MTRTNTVTAALHEATHRLPGVPAHEERGAGHQGRTAHGHGSAAHHHGRPNHSPTKPPRVLVGWQRRIARLFGQEI